MKDIEHREDGWNRMELRDRMRVQLASVVALVTATFGFVLLMAGFRLYRKIARIAGTWSEPPLEDAILGCFAIYLVVAIVFLAIRWLLIYKWVAMKEG